MQSRVIPAASRRRPKSRTRGDVFPESPGGNGAGPDVVWSVIFPGGASQINTGRALYALAGGMELEVDLVFQSGAPAVRVNDHHGALSMGSQGLKKTYLKLKIAQETRLLKGFLINVRYLI